MAATSEKKSWAAIAAGGIEIAKKREATEAIAAVEAAAVERLRQAEAAAAAEAAEKREKQLRKAIRNGEVFRDVVCSNPLCDNVWSKRIKEYPEPELSEYSFHDLLCHDCRGINVRLYSRVAMAFHGMTPAELAEVKDGLELQVRATDTLNDDIKFRVFMDKTFTCMVKRIDGMTEDHMHVGSELLNMYLPPSEWDDTISGYVLRKFEIVGVMDRTSSTE